jgi:hypothetical protein
VHDGTFRDEIGRAVDAIGDDAIPHLLRESVPPDGAEDGSIPERRAAYALHCLDRMDRLHPRRALEAAADDRKLLADVLDAYARVREGEAAPLILAYVDSDAPGVRQAARTAFAAYVTGPAPQNRRKSIRLFNGQTSTQRAALKPRIRATAASHTTDLYLLHNGTSTRVAAQGGIPSLERALNDPETSPISAWRDSPDDRDWVNAPPDVVLRQIDRFHGIPEGTPWGNSWAEWLYFNGRSNEASFYLTFLVGPRTPSGARSAGVRLQIERGGQMESFAGSAELTDAELSRAPDLTIGASSVSGASSAAFNGCAAACIASRISLRPGEPVVGGTELPFRPGAARGSFPRQGCRERHPEGLRFACPSRLGYAR